MKIVQFIHGLNMGGAETLVKEYALRLNKIDNVEVVVLCLERLGSPYEELLEKNGIKVIYIVDSLKLSKRNSLIVKCINRVKRYVEIKRQLNYIKPDIIHVHLSLNEYLRYLHLSHNVAIVYTQHSQVDRWIEKYEKDVNNVKWLLNHYKMKIIALNDEMKDDINNLFGINDTIVLNNGVDISKFNNADKKENVRQKLGLHQTDMVVGHVGRFNEVKNHEFLIDIFFEMYKKNSNAKLIMIGKGDTEQRVREKILNLGIYDAVKILHDRTDICDLLQAMDIMIFPSISEGLGIAVVEAQVAGIACLVSDRVPIATQISNCIEYMSLRESASSWARKAEEMCSCYLVPQYYDIEKWDINCIVDKLYKIYSDLLISI